MVKRLATAGMAVLTFLLGATISRVVSPVPSQFGNWPHETPTAFVHRQNQDQPCKANQIYVTQHLYLADAEIVDVRCTSLQLRLVKAAQAGDLEVLRTALAEGATPNSTGIDEQFNYRRPLVEAAFAGQTRALEVLLDNGGDVNDYHVCCMTKQSLLMIATSRHDTQSVKLLLSRGANTQFSGLEGETAFQIATDNGFHDILQLLTEARRVP